MVDGVTVQRARLVKPEGSRGHAECDHAVRLFEQRELAASECA